MERDSAKSSPQRGAPSTPSIVTPTPGESEDDSSRPTSTPQTPVQWENGKVEDLINRDKMIAVDAEEIVVSAFETMERDELSCLPVSQNGEIVDSFDYTDLNAYLLLVLGHISVPNASPEFKAELQRIREGIPSTVGWASHLGVKDSLVRVSATSPMSTAITRFAHGVHRIAATDANNKVIGILSQRRMLDYIWTNIRRFPALEPALDRSLDDLHIGTYQGMFTLQGDSPAIEAFAMLHDHAVSSLAVVDREHNLLGNISVADVGLVTNSRRSGLLYQSSKHYLTEILDERGLVDGKDSVPVFFVERSTSLRKVIAKLVATRAHRLWIVEPVPDPVTSGKLLGVVSLTDIFNFIARQSGHSLDPESARRERRSSSSSVRSNSQVRRQLFQH